MSQSESPDGTELHADTNSPEHMVALAKAINDLGHALMDRDLAPDEALALTESVDQIRESVSNGRAISPAESAARRKRIATFLETGEWPVAPPDGSRIVFDPASPFGGDLNPFSVGAEYFRDGDEVVARVHPNRGFEGAPQRLHGGVICALFDETMGSVFQATGTPSAFTGELSVRFEAPCPIDTALEFRARLVSTEGRRRYLEAEATGPDGQFAKATATFIDMLAVHFK